jgi:hypothetical protein
VELTAPPSVLGQSLARASDAPASRTVVIPLDFQTNGPALALAPSADHSAASAPLSAIVTEEEDVNDPRKVAADLAEKAKRFVRDVGTGIEKVLRRAASEKEPKPEEEEIQQSDETSARVLDSLFADAVLLPVDVDFPFVETESEENGSAVWTTAALLAGFTFPTWDEKDEQLAACGLAGSDR